MNRGKQFETQFRKNFRESFPQSFCYRLPDQVSGYHNSKNVCDFICFNKDTLYLLEIKTHQGNTFPFQNLSQYEYLLSYKNLPGIVIGVILWMIDHDTIVFLPIQTIEKMKSDKKKSFNIKDVLSSDYDIIIIPVKKKRVFLEADYTILYSYYKEANNKNNG